MSDGLNQLLRGIKVRIDEHLPDDTILVIPGRRTKAGLLEPLEDWAERCRKIINVGQSDETTQEGNQ